MEASDEAVVRINRDAVPWRDRFVAYRVIVDGKQMASLGNGDAIDFTVGPGEHDIWVAARGRRAVSAVVRFVARPGEIQRFFCKPNGPAFLATYHLISRRPWIRLERR
jgi:hypothetical protein